MAATSEQHSQASQQLIEALAAGDLEGVRSLYAGPADIDDPFAGHQVDGGFEAFVANWQPARDSIVKSVETTNSTSADGYVGTEITLHLERDGKPIDLPIVLVSELNAQGALVRSRLYYRRSRIDGKQHYRDRMLQDEIRYEFHPTITEYQRALLVRDTDAFLATFAEDGYFDGHGESYDVYERRGMTRYEGMEQLRVGIGQMMAIGKTESPAGRLEHVNAFTDGTTTVLEFNILRPEENRIHAGVACYELNGDGKLKAARVYDEAW